MRDAHGLLRLLLTLSATGCVAGAVLVMGCAGAGPGVGIDAGTTVDAGGPRDDARLLPRDASLPCEGPVRLSSVVPGAWPDVWERSDVVATADRTGIALAWREHATSGDLGTPRVGRIRMPSSAPEIEPFPEVVPLRFVDGFLPDASGRTWAAYTDAGDRSGIVEVADTGLGPVHWFAVPPEAGRFTLARYCEGSNLASIFTCSAEGRYGLALLRVGPDGPPVLSELAPLDGWGTCDLAGLQPAVPFCAAHDGLVSVIALPPGAAAQAVLVEWSGDTLALRRGPALLEQVRGGDAAGRAAGVLDGSDIVLFETRTYEADLRAFRIASGIATLLGTVPLDLPAGGMGASVLGAARLPSGAFVAVLRTAELLSLVSLDGVRLGLPTIVANIACNSSARVISVGGGLFLPLSCYAPRSIRLLELCRGSV